MTDEQIFELAKTCGIEHWSRSGGERWECDEEQLLKFAKAIAKAMFEKGYYKGYDKGYDDGEDYNAYNACPPDDVTP